MSTVLPKPWTSTHPQCVTYQLAGPFVEGAELFYLDDIPLLEIERGATVIVRSFGTLCVNRFYKVVFIIPLVCILDI